MGVQTWDGGGRTLIIAHRGDTATAPENTVPAVRAARAAGADGVEIDVRLSGDGVPVVVHDADLRRLTGTPGRVGELPAAMLATRRVRAQRPVGRGEVLPPDAGLRPSEPLEEAPLANLDEIVRACGDELLLNVELKAERDASPRAIARLVAAVADVLRGAGLGDRLLVSSFHPLALLAMRRALPEARGAFLFEGGESLPLRSGAGALVLWPRLAVSPERKLVSNRFMARWRAVGARIHVWTVNDPREMAWMTTLGVDAVITDEPRLLYKVEQWGAGGWRIAEGLADCADAPAVRAE
jgi:glycerophosphoryl diester phosphodiesterase